MNSGAADTDPAGARFPRGKLLLLVLLAAGLAIGYANREQLSLAALGEREVQLRDYYHANPVAVIAVGFLLYAAVSGLSIPGGAVVLTLAYGWLFGPFVGVAVVSFASTAGATLAFLSSRYLLRDYVQRRFGKWLTRFNDALERDGALYLFTLRLVVAVPFFLINLVMGLTPIRAGTFWWVSQLGMLPGTAVYVYAGSTVPSLSEIEGVGDILSLETIIAFAILGLFPIATKKALDYFKPQDKESETGTANASAETD